VPELAANDRVSHYRLIEPIGQGGMGQVWIAQDTTLPRRVAVKLVHAHLAADPVATERLLREARAAASVDHPHVVTVYEAGVEAGRPFLVTQYLEGETLEQRLARGPLPVAEAVALGRAIADALAEVHALGIVHRDLKPANVMLTSRGPRVLDFGISAMSGGARLTQTGEMLGTPGAMSPEQLRGAEPDARSDLWALGVLLHHALTGVRPFDGDHAATVLQRVLNESPEPPSRRNPAVTPALDALVARLLSKDPERRPQRAEEVVADLVRMAPAAEDDVTRPMRRARAVPRLAVLPFEVMGADADDQFLAAGLTEDLIVDLARVEGLEVAARGEVMAYRDRGLPPRTVARELGVDYVVQGSVRRAGTRGRITAQLVRAADGHAVWADRFDRVLEDLFDVQAELSTQIVSALAITLRPGEREILDRSPTLDREAYASFLRGRALADQVRRTSNWEAEASFRDALARDPRFALAHAALAECLARRASSWWVGPEVLDEAALHARRALELDPGLPQGHVALGMIANARGDAAGVLEAVTAAQLLDSNDPQIMLWIGRGYMGLGRPGDAIQVLERAIRLRPREYTILSAYADCSDLLGRKDALAEAVARIRELIVDLLERNPHDSYARSILAIALAQTDDPEGGMAQAERAIAEEREDGRVLYNAACAFTYGGHLDRAIALLSELLRTHPGYPRAWLRQDPDLKPLHAVPAFREIAGLPHADETRGLAPS
jgi:TolB-like protein/Flp pilus assembly protein TadD